MTSYVQGIIAKNEWEHSAGYFFQFKLTAVPYLI